MKEGLATYLKFGNRYYGVEQTEVNGEEVLHAIILKKKKNELDIVESFETKSLEDLSSHIPKGKALSLTINNRSVLTKHVKGKVSESQRLVQLAFPSIKVEDFFYETLSQGENHFVSICRKSHVKDLLRAYSSNGLNVIDFTLGNLVCASLIPFADTKNFKSPNASITIEENGITDITPKNTQSESSYDINGLEIKSAQLLSFAVALNSIVKNQTTQSSFNEVKKELSTAYCQNRFTNQFPKIGLGALFVVLLVNFLFFNHYYNEVNTLKETAQVLEASKAKMVGLDEKVQKTEKMVSDVLKSSSSKSSFYVNEIIGSLPHHLLLTELNYQPLARKIKEGKSIENQEDTILISGQTNKQILFSDWISQLEVIPWINSVNILNFEDVGSGASKFAIKLNLKDDTKK